MKMLVKTMMLSGIAVAAMSTAAVAGNTIAQQRLAERNFEYFSTPSAMPSAGKSIQPATGKATNSKVSQYPCGRCVYDVQLGGYVEKPGRR